MSWGNPVVDNFYFANSFSVTTMQKLPYFYSFPLFSSFSFLLFLLSHVTDQLPQYPKRKQGFSKIVFKESFFLFYVVCFFK